MKRNLLLMLLVFTGSTLSLYSQVSSHARESHVQAMIRQAGISGDKAQQVSVIQDAYKAGLQEVIKNKSLTDADRRIKIDLLIAEKNKKLAQVLSPSQLEKLIPLSEQRKGLQLTRVSQPEGTASLKDQKMSVKEQQRKAVMQLQSAYEQRIRKVKQDASLTEDARQSKVAELRDECGQKMSEILTAKEGNAGKR